MKYTKFLLVFMSIFLMTGIMTVGALESDTLNLFPQDSMNTGKMELVTRLAYYLADDAESIQQVFQLVLDGDANQTRQITHATSDVLTFGAAYDSLAVAYISDGQLWLQPIHTGEPEALVAINTANAPRNPVFSQDGQYLAYADNGVWMVDLSTRQAHQLLQDVPLSDGASNALEYRIYAPKQFVMDSEDSVEWLVVDVGIWEWKTAGLYNLATGELQMIEDLLYTDLLPLDDGQVLFYGNTGLDGEPVLHVAADVNHLEMFDQVLNFSALIENGILFADQAIEIAPGTVRIFGSAVGAALDFSGRFYFDYDLMGDGDLALNMVTFPLTETGRIDTGSLSPDGRLIPVYMDATWTETGSKSGQLIVLDVLTGAEVVAIEGIVTAFQWQP